MVQNAKYSICGGRWVNEWRIDQLEGLSALVWGLSTPSMALAIEATIGEPWLVVENVVFLWSQLAWCITHTSSTCLRVPSSVVSACEQLQVWRWPWRQIPGLKIAWIFVWGSIRELESTCGCKCTCVHSQHICDRRIMGLAACYPSSRFTERSYLKEMR